jgi:hypothetical protein
MVVIKYLKFIIVLSISTIILSCKSTYQSLTYSRKEYFGSEMRTDGYYFRSITDSRDTNMISTAVMFFRNGNFRRLETFIPATTNLTVESYIGQYAQTENNLQAGTGIFIVRDSDLMVEYWTYASHNPKPTGIERGKIVNDTTLNISLFGREGLWHFKKYDIKLDSVYSYIN